MASPRGRPRRSLRRSKRSSTELHGLSEEDRKLIEQFLSKLESISEVQTVVLFGSFARSDVDRRSDIDLLLVTDMRDPGSLRPRLAQLIGDLKPHREINPTLTNLHDLDPSFLRNVFKEGIVLKGKLLLTPKNLALQPRVIVAYDLSEVKPSSKVHVSRLIHGFRSRKRVGGKTRTYDYQGLKDRFGATLVSRSALMMKTEDANGFIRELEKRGIRCSQWEVYL